MKLPVFKAVGATFAFAAANWRDLIRIAWAPVVLSIVAEQVTQPIGRGYLADLASIAVHDTASVLFVIWQNLPALLIALVANTLPRIILITGILRLVIHNERPARPFYLSFGRAESRLFFTILIAVLIDVLFQVLTLVTVLISTYATQAIPRIGVLVSFVIVMAAVFLAVRAYLRLSLMAPAAIAARRVGLIPSFRATRENEMHLLGFWLVWTGIGHFCFAAITAIMFSTITIDFQPTFNPAESSVGGHYNGLAAAGRFDIGAVPGFFLAAITWLVNALAVVLTAIAGGIAWRMIHQAPAPAETVNTTSGPDTAIASQPTP